MVLAFFQTRICLAIRLVHTDFVCGKAAPEIVTINSEQQPFLLQGQSRPNTMQIESALALNHEKYMKFLGSQKLIKMALLLCLSLTAISKSSSQNNLPDPDKQLDVTEALFKCLTEMARSSTGAFFVDNMLGKIEATVAIANSETGGEYPAGSLVSLIPTEVIIKHQEG